MVVSRSRCGTCDGSDHRQRRRGWNAGEVLWELSPLKAAIQRISSPDNHASQHPSELSNTLSVPVRRPCPTPSPLYPETLAISDKPCPALWLPCGLACLRI